ncbi:DUF2628 domain-containing protein [Acinetobacter sp. 194]|uniref:DUF2628 domain-containing protein n=1 Tax=Acinetobacter shaoyimingii TaxID=2715164 RepID=UPI00140DA568|nr:DUF2628 domain-containing protein [Acinetobacter shaoyimingii]NHB56602.1 DUF2628 domain-containing protein [Acinetobacter shaoyimingii]
MNEQELTRIFIGSRADQYLKKWQDQKLQMHWPALIFGMYWLLYRKMYLYCFLMFCGTCLLTTLLVWAVLASNVPVELVSPIGFVPNILLSLFGYRLYQRFVYSKVKPYEEKPKYSLEIFKLYGGVTWSVPVLFVLLYVMGLVVFTIELIKFMY